MTILIALTLLLRADRPAVRGLAADRGGVSAPGLATAVAVIVIVVGVVVTGAHELVWEAVTGAFDALTGG